MLVEKRGYRCSTLKWFPKWSDAFHLNLVSQCFNARSSNNQPNKPPKKGSLSAKRLHDSIRRSFKTNILTLATKKVTTNIHMFQYPFMSSKTSSTSLDWDSELIRPSQDAGRISPKRPLPRRWICSKQQQHVIFILDPLPRCWDCRITLKLLD